MQGILLIRLWDYDNNKGDYVVGIRYTITMSNLSTLSFGLVWCMLNGGKDSHRHGINQHSPEEH